MSKSKSDIDKSFFAFAKYKKFYDINCLSENLKNKLVSYTLQTVNEALHQANLR